MSSGKPTRARSERIETLGLPRGRFQQWWNERRDAHFWGRIGMAVLAAAIVLSACLTWRPPFSYRRDDIAARAIIARVPFAVEDAVKTELARQRFVMVAPGSMVRHKFTARQQPPNKVLEELALIFARLQTG